MADHSKPTTTSTYVNFVSELDGRLDDISLGLDPATTSPTNLATNSIRWTSASNKWQKYNGTTWNDLSSAYSININGTVGATTPASGAFTTLSATGNVTLGDASSDTVTINGTVGAGVVISGSTATDALRITQTGAGNAFVVEDSTNPDSTPFVVDASGNVIVGNSTTNVITGLSTPQFQVQGITTGAAGLSVHASDTTSSGGWQSAKSRGTLSAPTIVNSGDNFGQIRFAGYDGSGFIRAAEINAQSDGTPGTNDMPGRLIFSTTADGASAPTERMRIDSSGNVGIGTTTTTYKLNIAGTSSVYQELYTNNVVTVTTNAGTVPVTYRLNTFTNSSAATMTITMATASAVDGQMTIVRIYDFSAVAQTISWVNTENSTVTVPTTSNGSTTLPLTVGFMYNSATSKWRCIALA